MELVSRLNLLLLLLPLLLSCSLELRSSSPFSLSLSLSQQRLRPIVNAPTNACKTRRLFFVTQPHSLGRYSSRHHLSHFLAKDGALFQPYLSRHQASGLFRADWIAAPFIDSERSTVAFFSPLFLPYRSTLQVPPSPWPSPPHTLGSSTTGSQVQLRQSPQQRLRARVCTSLPSPTQSPSEIRNCVGKPLKSATPTLLSRMEPGDTVYERR